MSTTLFSLFFCMRRNLSIRVRRLCTAQSVKKSLASVIKVLCCYYGVPCYDKQNIVDRIRRALRETSKKTSPSVSSSVLFFRSNVNTCLRFHLKELQKVQRDLFLLCSLLYSTVRITFAYRHNNDSQHSLIAH
jgi:hypothetical protein